MYKIIMTSFSVLVFLLNSCKSIIKEKKNLPVTNDTIQLKGISRDIPKSAEWRYYYSYDYIRTKKYEGIEGFRKLDNGFDSLCIRIQYNYSFEKKNQAIEFRKTNKGWEAEFFTLIKNYHSDSDSIISVENTSKLKEPKSGWVNFVNKLFAFEILTLPDDSQIPTYTSPMDGNSVIVQIATKSAYRIYGYSSPYANTSLEPAKKIEDIMELIEKEFGEKRFKKI